MNMHMPHYSHTSAFLSPWTRPLPSTLPSSYFFLHRRLHFHRVVLNLLEWSAGCRHEPPASAQGELPVCVGWRGGVWSVELESNQSDSQPIDQTNQPDQPIDQLD
jgi:hypothetical protein